VSGPIQGDIFMTTLARFLPLPVALVLSLSAASAHVTLENKEVAAGASFKLVLRVPHGCSGAATTKLRVRVPEVFRSAKPQPKPGWALEVVAARSAAGSGGHAHDDATAPQEVSWTGALEDSSYDEFVLWVSTAKTAPLGPVYVPIVQECGDRMQRWIEIPSDGNTPASLKSPAPSLRLIGQPS